ncbi:hypothetical protein PFTANZ_06116, partial [Plasmodium falciparum Tanzania (2000708)]
MAPKGRSTNEIELSARDVLENIGIGIYNQEKKKTETYESDLIGKLSKAEFLDGLRKASGWGVRTGLSHFSYLYFRKHTNNTIYSGDDRHPCHGRQGKRFDEGQKFECGNDKIIGNSDKYGACAPPRRRHMCDQNLEFLDNNHTDTIHDVLGNVLVTAKYEGESIVNNHPDKNSNGNKSGICTSLARSFADIGDIVRGKDMFKPNVHDKVEKGLQVVFGKIYNSLPSPAKSHYKDDNGSGNYYKLREAWWTANRDQVWEAITYKAPRKADYFRNISKRIRGFTDIGKCGHNKGSVPTYLDYVPQFLRWFDEWAEEFCRIRYHKLKRIKDACRNESKQLYCSHNGYDCRQMSWKKNIESREHYCTGCFSACSIYNMWVDKQKKEFEKQKEKYKNEIETYASNKDKTGSKINEEYYKKFYEKLKENYKNHESFLKLLNEGRYCKEELQGEENVDFTNTNEKGASYRSKYCKVCPYCGVDCVGKTCTPKEEIYPNCENNETYDPPDGAETTEINVINSGDEPGNITQKLKDFCEYKNKENGKNYEQWKCYYDNKKNNNKCKMEINIANSKLKNKITSFDFFFDLWIKNLLRDTINWKSELKNCINNTNKTNCNKECNENCKCFEKWVNQKEIEWNSMKELFKNKNGTSQNYYNKLKSHFDNYFFLVINNVNQGEEKWKKLKEDLEKDIKFKNLKKSTGGLPDSIKLLLDHENKNAQKCLENNPSEPCSKAEPQKSEEKNQPQDAPPNSCGAAGDKNGKTASVEQMCNNVKKYIEDNNTQTKKQTNTGCNKKGNSKKWECEYTRLVSGRGECMPPRRQTLCIYYLSDDKEKNNIETAEKLKDGVMKSAALETHFLWEKYKTDKNGGNSGKTLDDQLKEGNIPEDFIRQMFYTFGDYRDLCLGKDIGKTISGDNVDRATKNIKGVFTTNGKYNGETAETWWNSIQKKVWDSMVCSLSYNSTKSNMDENTSKQLIEKNNFENVSIKSGTSGSINLCEFASVPQFLRWMIEWSEHFCKKQQKHYIDLVEGCRGCDFSNDGNCTQKGNCKNCSSQCKEYQKFITQWKVQWEKQRNKYTELYGKINNDSNHLTDSIEKRVIDYFKTLNSNGTTYDNAGKYINKKGYINDCQESKQKNFEENNSAATDEKYALRDYPNDHEHKCNCKVKPPPPPPLRPLGLGRSGRQVGRRSRSQRGCQGNVVVLKKGRHQQVVVCRVRGRFPPPRQSAGRSETVDDLQESEEETAEEEEQQKEEACNIVEKLFENKDQNDKYFNDACSLKYSHGKEQFTQWKCINDTTSSPSGVTPPSPTSTCIPPRRQKLYVGKLHTLSDLTPLDLRKAFIEAAAVETFFAWHKFKMDKKKETEEKRKDTLYILLGEEKEENPEDKLKKGEIPEEFKRQMFYTFADYTDILFGRNVLNDTKNISENVTRILGDSQPSMGKLDDKRENWWKEYGPHIWDAMVCALSYNSNGNTIKIDKDMHTKLTKKDANNNYETVTFSGGFNSDKTSKTATITTKLVDFSRRPTFSRWLEEWGEEFCRQRTYKLEKIENECRGKYSNKYSSGDGENCEHIVHQDYGTLRNLQYPSCATSCRSYKKWINRKKDEFIKQQNNYHNEISNVHINNYHKGFSTTLKTTFPEATDFLASLKGPCSNNNNGEDTIDFNNIDKTYKHAKYCAPCPVFGVESKKEGWSKVTDRTCKNKKITEQNIKNMKSPIQQVVMLVSDKSTNDFAGDLEFCRDKGIFDGIRKDQWSCGYLCGLDICDLNSVNGKTNDQQNIQIRALLKRWVETFLEDYNKIKDKISHCTKNGNKSTCINGCQNKCECVGKWINIKRKEWKEITERYLKQYEHIDDSTSNILINFLEQGIFYSDIKKAKEGIENLNDLEESNGCTVNTISEIGEHKYNDDVECLLGKLEDIIESCKEKHDLNDRTQTPCDPFPSTQTSQIPHDDPDAPEDKQSPEFCADIPKIPNPSDGTLKVSPNKDKFSDKKNDKGKDKSTSKADDNTNIFIPSNCVKNAAYKSREKIIKKKNYLSVTSDSIKNEMNNCKSAETIIDRKNGSKTIDKNTKLEEIFNIHSECVNEAKDIFDREQTWSCGKNINSREKYLCLPPRRKFMCMKKIEDMQSTNIKDKKKLLEEVIKVAKEEGVRILENFKSENGTNFSEICDGMKYSFADLGDIIRGRDLWKKYPRHHRTEQRLQNIFKEIHNNMSEDEGKKTYSYDGPKYSKLRND